MVPLETVAGRLMQEHVHVKHRRGEVQFLVVVVRAHRHGVKEAADGPGDLVPFQGRLASLSLLDGLVDGDNGRARVELAPDIGGLVTRSVTDAATEVVISGGGEGRRGEDCHDPAVREDAVQRFDRVELDLRLAARGGVAGGLVAGVFAQTLAHGVDAAIFYRGIFLIQLYSNLNIALYYITVFQIIYLS